MKLSSNLLLETVNQVFAIVIPLITLPYVAHTLGAKLVGINAYTLSIATLFGIVALLGINIYGSRAIASVRGNRARVTETFWGIFLLKALSTLLCLGLYTGFVWRISYEHKWVLLFQMLNIVAVGLDVTWLFAGFEDFFKVTLRNVSVRILGLASLLLFVSDPSDFKKFLLVAPLTTIAGHLLLFPKTLRYVSGPTLSKSFFRKHLGPMLSVFISQVAINFYVTFDKVLVGMLAGDQSVGLYDYAQKISRISTVAIGALGTVMLPRMAFLWSQQRKSEISIYLDRSIRFNAFIAFPVFLGLFATSQSLVKAFLPVEFQQVSLLIKILSPCVLLWAINNITGFQILIPSGRELRLTQSVIVGAITGIGLNILLIPRLGLPGAVIASGMAELTVTGIQVYFARNIGTGLPIRSIAVNFIASFVMFAVIYLLPQIIKSPLYALVTQIILGIVIYLLICKLLRVSIFIELISDLKNRITLRQP